MKYLFLIILYLRAMPILGQSKLPEFGVPDKAELELTDCPFDKGAEAMTLFEDRETKMEAGNTYFTTSTIIRVRIKIFNYKGLSAGNIRIPIIGDAIARSRDIEAYAYSLAENGKMETVKLDRKEIFRQPPNNKEPIGWIRFAVPGIKAGSVIEYQYTQKEDNNPYLANWVFQSALPVQKSYCRIIVPAQLDVSYSRISQVPISEKNEVVNPKSARAARHLYFEAANIPSYEEEPFGTSIWENLQRVEFSIRSNGFFAHWMFGWSDNVWPSVCRDVHDALKPQLERSLANTVSIIDSAVNMKTPAEKIEYLFRTVQKRMHWNGDLTIKAGDIEKAWLDGRGDNSDINLILLNLLTKIGYGGEVLLGSSRDLGLMGENSHFIRNLNSMAILVKDSSNTYILDPSDSTLNINTPPNFLVNRNALVVDELAGHWITIHDFRPLYKVFINAMADLDSNLLMHGVSGVQYYDYARQQGLEVLEQNREKDRSLSFEDDPDASPGKPLKLNEIKVSNIDDPGLPLSLSAKFGVTVHHTGNLIYFEPAILYPSRRNPFVADHRQSAIDFVGNRQLVYSFLFHIPENMHLESMPRNVTLSTPDSSMLFQRTCVHDEHNLLFKFSFRINKPYFEAAAYEDVKVFFVRFYEYLGEQVVLKNLAAD